MTNENQTKRKWTRSCGIFPCWVLPHQKVNGFCNGAVINIGRGGFLLETDMKFFHGDRLTIIHQKKVEIEDLHIDHDIHGTVRWGLSAKDSLMGLYYFGIELDEILPLRRAADYQGASPRQSQIFADK